MSFDGMGAVPDSEAGTCGFRVWAPNASSVHVTRSFCEWRETEHPLAQQGNGCWATAVGGVGEPYQEVASSPGCTRLSSSWFVIQNGDQHWRVDAYARDVALEGEGT